MEKQMTSETNSPMQQPDTEESASKHRYDDQNRRLCSASKSGGGPCQAPAMRGQRVCRVHGGSSPQAKRAAKLRLLDLVDPAVERLAAEMETAERASDRLRAAEAVLDRTGYSRGSELAITHAEATEEIYRRLIDFQSRRPEQDDE